MKTPHYSADDIAPLNRRYRLARLITALSLAALILLLAFFNAFASEVNWLRALVQLVPLLLFAPAIRRDSHRTYSWLCFVILFYFTGFVVTAMGPAAGVVDYLAVALSVVLFCAAMMASRWCQHSRLAEQQNPPAVG